ncbi:hypothetical protein AB0G79_08980 [Streptomyces sp. NPDC020807]|uniref:hypothetical protein n=1 Tax=Streptomyces sp. NPDC020807 TaxID=3155119 RepID=UPI0033FA0E41
MSDVVKVVKLYAKGAPVGVLDGRLVGLLAHPEQAAEWAVSPEGDGFRFTVKGTEDTIVAEGAERAPAAVRPDASPASLWRLQRAEPDGGVRTVTGLDDLDAGLYVIDQNGLPLGRDLFEDRSSLPKPVVLRTDEREPQWRVEILA